MTIAFIVALGFAIGFMVLLYLAYIDWNYEILEKERYQSQYDELAKMYDAQTKELNLERDRLLKMTESFIIIKNQVDLSIGERETL